MYHYSNIPRLYSQWLNSVTYSATSHWTEARDAIWRRFDIIFTLCWRQSSFPRRLTVQRFSRVNNVRNACKRQHTSQNCWRDFFIWWRKNGRIWRIQLLFSSYSMCLNRNRSALVRDLLSNHSLLVSCKKLNHSRSALVIWFTLQLTLNSDLLLN